MAGQQAIILGQCSCGEILMKDLPHTEAFWTRMESVRIVMAKLQQNGKIIEMKKCPSCGGNLLEKIGDFFHPALLALHQKGLS